MLSIFDQGAPRPCPAPFNMAAHVLQKAADLADKPALEVLGTGDVWRFGRIEQAVRGTATGLLRAGLTPGDIVLLRLGNTVDFPVAYLGALAAGLVPVPTSAQLTGAEVAAMLDGLRPAAILHDGDVSTAPHPVTIEGDALRAMRQLPQADWHMGSPDRLGYIVYTSGTSGKPRAVAHAHRAIWARQMMMQGWYGLRPDDRLLHAGAFNWTFTLGTGLMDPWTMGATALIPAPGTPPEDLPALLADAQATIFAAAPGVYRKALHADMPDLPTLRHGLCAGEKLSPHLEEMWTKATGTPVYEAYGMSECSTFVSASPAHPALGGALGRPQTGRRIAIIGPDGPAPLGDTGVIAVHRSDPGLMLEYMGAPEETRQRFQDEWFLTGDLGRMDGDGQIHYMGRDDDMMNAGGYRVSPLEVEAALGAMPGLIQIGVTDVAVKEDVSIIAAFYTAPTPIPDTDLQAFASRSLARYKQPRAYVHIDAFPTGANGKLSRSALKSLFPKAPK